LTGVPAKKGEEFSVLNDSATRDLKKGLQKIEDLNLRDEKAG
jgi:hypothetical protein